MSSTTPTCEDPIVGEIEKKDECPAQQPSHQEEPTEQKNEVEKKVPESSRDAQKLQVKPKSPMVVHSDLQEEESQSKAEQATSSASAAASSASVSAGAPPTTAPKVSENENPPKPTTPATPEEQEKATKQQQMFVDNYRLGSQLFEQLTRVFPINKVSEQQLTMIAAKFALNQFAATTAREEQNGVKTAAAITSTIQPIEPQIAVSPAPARIQVLASLDLPPSPAPDQSKKDLVPEEEEDQAQKKKAKLEIQDE